MQQALPVLQPLAPPGAEHLIEVAFKGNRRAFFVTADPAVREGQYVVVEAERGEDLGRVRSLGGVARSKCSAAGNPAPLRVLREATPEEVRDSIVLRADEERVRRQTRELVERHKLNMKVSEAEWQWDRNKLTIFFTAERRVDFRELVRDLARTFRTRIELKQIGVRDEAALLGGLGRCGRQLCCATWLREIRPVSLQFAKDQNLSLNPSQISGTCGRLMCCLTYEHDAYVQARKRFPREGKLLQTSMGTEKVIGIDIWRESVTLLNESRERRVITLAELRQEIAAAGGGRREGGADGADGAQARAPRAPRPAEEEPRRAEGEEPSPRGNGDRGAAEAGADTNRERPRGRRTPPRRAPGDGRAAQPAAPPPPAPIRAATPPSDGAAPTADRERRERKPSRERRRRGRPQGRGTGGDQG